MINEKNKLIIKLSDRNLAVLVFSLFFSWLLAFPFEGQVLYALMEKYRLTTSDYIYKSIVFHFIGLISCSFYIKNIKSAKMLISFSIIICIFGTSVFLFKPTMWWEVALIVVSCVSGASVAAWGYYLKEMTDTINRTKMVADGLIFSNILMIVINVVTIHYSVYAGLILSIILLGAGLFFVSCIPLGRVAENRVKKKIINTNVTKTMVLLCVFIIIITINSGLMYQVINPYFKHLKNLVSWYWAFPYIVAIFIMRNLSGSKRTYMLYVAIAMMGLGFILFLVLDRSSFSYIIINTLMLGAFGIYDLFWWSIMGEMLDYTTNPSKLLGFGLSSNVLGIYVGGLIGNIIYNTSNSKLNASLLALIVAFIILIILPLLHNQLSNLLINHSYMISVRGKEKEKEKEKNLYVATLTERENQVAGLLLKGRTYKMIAEELYLSENTVKTHIKSIYSKLNIQSKEELIKLINNKHKQ